MFKELPFRGKTTFKYRVGDRVRDDGLTYLLTVSVKSLKYPHLVV